LLGTDVGNRVEQSIGQINVTSRGLAVGDAAVGIVHRVLSHVVSPSSSAFVEAQGPACGARYGVDLHHCATGGCQVDTVIDAVDGIGGDFHGGSRGVQGNSFDIATAAATERVPRDGAGLAEGKNHTIPDEAVHYVGLNDQWVGRTCLRKDAGAGYTRAGPVVSIADGRVDNFAECRARVAKEGDAVNKAGSRTTRA